MCIVILNIFNFFSNKFFFCKTGLIFNYYYMQMLYALRARAAAFSFGRAVHFALNILALE